MNPVINTLERLVRCLEQFPMPSFQVVLDPTTRAMSMNDRKTTRKPVRTHKHELTLVEEQTGQAYCRLLQQERQE